MSDGKKEPRTESREPQPVSERSVDANLNVSLRYVRSVHLQRDFANERLGVRDYQVTPLVVQTTQRIIDGLNPNSTNRAFSLIGPYGSGKSAFGVFVAHYLQGNDISRQRLMQAHTVDGVPIGLMYDAPMLLPLLISGNNASLRHALLQAMQRLCETTQPLRDKRLRLPQIIAAEAGNADIDPQRIAHLVAELNAAIAERTAFHGLLIIIDELGQFLDYAARQGDERELFTLQTLAEMAARSGATPCVVLTILHQSFDRYTITAGAGRRTEWAKVQGRYIDLPFQEPPIQMLRMVAHALTPPATNRFAKARRQWAEEVALTSDQLRPPEVNQEEWKQLITRAYPLHPTVLVALPQLFRQLAQNERSLFAFLTSSEPWGVQDVSFSTSSNTDTLTIYRLTHLYEYVHATLGASLFGRARGKRWAELAEARAQLPDEDRLLTDVLTTIGTLGALGQTREMKANTAQITFALRDVDDGNDIERALEELQTKKHITYRQHSNSFVIWEGSDLDIDNMAQRARREIGDRTTLVNLLRQHAESVPLVARRHSYETGAVRVFTVRFVDTVELFTNPAPAQEADGDVLYVVPPDDEALGAAHAWAMQPEREAETRRIIVLPERTRELRDLLLEVAALRRIYDEQPELEGDRAARREVSSRLIEAQQALTETIAEQYGPAGSSWYWCSRLTHVRTARRIDELLSKACDVTYAQTPRIWNELIVRRQLSSAAAKARRNLIEAMLDHSREEFLGLTGYPPERAIYESVFKQTGIHRQDDNGVWCFGPPDGRDPYRLYPTWNAMQQFLDSTEGHSSPVIKLFETLEAPPFGVKAGLIPLLFMALYQAHAGEVSLYEHGNFVPTPDIATFERMLRQPGYFAVRRSRVTGTRMAIYERLARALAPKALDKTIQPAVLDATTPLLRFLTTLPPYSRVTRHVSSRAQAIRQALRDARAPDELLFERLPLACEMLPFTPDTPADSPEVEAFFTALREGLTELQNAYAALVEQTRERIRAAFGALATETTALRFELTERYNQIAALTTDSQLRALGVRLESAGPGDAWVESVAALIGRKPLDVWSDDDVRAFTLQIADVGRQLRNVEQMAVASQAVEPDTPIRRVGITNGHGEQSTTLKTTHRDTTMQRLYNELTQVLAKYDTLTLEQRMSVIVDLLEPSLASTAEMNGNGHQ